VNGLLERCTSYVLPSYHEGLPRSVLEAMATGRAVITTDTIGCRDTIDEPAAMDGERVRWGRNGALVPVRDEGALAAAMIKVARDHHLARQMGHASREMAEKHFDVRMVNQRMLQEMAL
jgi:glycosyltransferase involved in cell wall biosynthesis